MKQIATIALASLVIASVAAHAQDAVVIKDTRQYVKDTRQYLPFTISVSGPVGCTMPLNLEHPNLDDPKECRVTRGRLTTSGELLVRYPEEGICRRTVFSGGTKRMGGSPAGDVVPDQSTTDESFACDASGARIP